MHQRLACVASFAFLAACSGSVSLSSSSSGPNGPGGEGADGGGSITDPGVATWSELTPDPSASVGKVAGDARGVWAVLGPKADDHSAELAIRAGTLAADGTYREKYTMAVDPIILSNYAVASMTPVDDTTAVIGGEWFVSIIGDGAPREIGRDTSSYVSGVYGRGPNDVWMGTRTGVLSHWTGASAMSYPLADETTTTALWQSKSTLFFAANDLGLRSASLPIPTDWNGATDRVLSGSFYALAGDADDDAFAAGKGGLIAHYDGTTWAPQASGVATDLSAIAVRNGNDAWAIGESALLHYDGKAWALVKEAGMPSGGGSVAALADGTLFLTSEGKLYRRSPGPVLGVPTTATVDAGQGGVCGAGEPNETSETATEEQPTFHVDACLGNKDDDDYSFVTPSPAAGGYVDIKLTDTSAVHPLLGTDIKLSTYDDTSIVMYDSKAGDAKHLFLPIMGAVRKTLHVTSNEPVQGAYALDMTWNAFDDAFEPNDTDDEAKVITTGTTISAFLPSGFARRVSQFDEPDLFDSVDIYEVQRPVGPYSVAVTNVPSGAKIHLAVTYAEGGSIGSVDGAASSPVTYAGTLTTPTTLHIAIKDYGTRVLTNDTPPAAFTQKYSLVVTN